MSCLSSRGRKLLWTPVSKTIEPSAKENPETNAANVIAMNETCAARRTLCTEVSANTAPTITQGRLGRTRSPSSAPASAPSPSPVTTVPHGPAPPSECFAMYGPRTKNGA